MRNPDRAKWMAYLKYEIELYFECDISKRESLKHNWRGGAGS